MKYSTKTIVLSLLVFVLALIIFFEILIHIAYYYLPNWESLWEESPVLLIITILAVGVAIVVKNAKDTPFKKFAYFFIIIVAFFVIFYGIAAFLDELSWRYSDFEIQYFLLVIIGSLLIGYFSLYMRDIREQKKIALPEETIIEKNYFKRLLKPSERKLISSIVVASILPLPYPCFVCFGGLEWGFIPFLFNALGALSFGVFSPLMFFMSPFSIYALLTYLLINLIDKRAPIDKNKSLISFSVLVFVIMPILFTGIFIFNVGDLRKTAVGDFYVAIAKTTSETKFCEEGSSSYDKTSCYISIAKKSGDLGVCDTLKNSEGRVVTDAKSRCYMQVGVSTKDPSICKQIDSYYYMKQCFDSIDFGIDLTTCDNIDNPTKWLCYADVAANKGDLNICNNIQVQKSKDECYSKIALRSQNFTICDSIQNEGIQQHCYEFTYTHFTDKSMCDNIKGEAKRDKCYKIFE